MFVTVNCDPLTAAGLVESIQVTGGVKLKVDCNVNPAAVVGHERTMSICPSTLRDTQSKFGRQIAHGSPADTTNATADPAATEAPAAGFCEMTLPVGIVADSCEVTVPTTKPALVIAAVAAACVSPTTFGAVMADVAVVTYRLTGEPFGAIAPLIGDCAITLGVGLSGGLSCVIVPMVRACPKSRESPMA